MQKSLDICETLLLKRELDKMIEDRYHFKDIDTLKILDSQIKLIHSALKEEGK
ncbi:hypothetical protein SAMN04487936_11568 [Halobacillus dabanensis]|uniref:Uncharacterized protein n=1 Tax=Halobacillus dabanensis TaxID=240302 RepID=A0A1I3ZZV0_HALDA|nr:hypothetical protein [Halobacillus dabanensis]SFK49397.1 hypothetical protein SAMN04487936_11568 [Halobacillus dabanensis]